MKDCRLGRGRAAEIATMGVPFIGLLLLLAVGSPSFAQNSGNAAGSPAGTCPGDNGGISLPPGFCATVFADNVGHARQMVVAPNGVVYVNTWSGRYYGNDTPPAGGFLIALQDTKGDGHADVVKRFGQSFAEGNHGGTGIGLYNGALYAETNDRIVRYALPAGTITPAGMPETIISGLPIIGDHPMHPFIIDRQGNLYVDLGSATNSCQVENRTLESPGINPCTELETRAGIWRYDANRTGQRFSPTERFVTGLRNGEGFAFDAQGTLYATQHGRDQLSQNWPKLYPAEEGPHLPAEELVRLERGADYGWPECYFDGEQRKLVLAPEYGGDGGKAVGVCAQKQTPIAWFPAHWAPNALAIYQGRQFPDAYRGGAFIAFHGSWNRAPYPQGGYNVVFQPLAEGKPSGTFIVFADGFAGAVKEPGQAAHRPSGLAIAPDGALYISDDQHGRIWRVSFHGATATTGLVAAPAPAPSVGTSTNANVPPPEGINPNAGSQLAVASLPVPSGATQAQVALGARIFHGEADNGTCAGCHGSNAKGTPLAPDLTSGKWLWGDGTLASITRIIANGVPNPKNYRSPMPPQGGTQLSDSDLKDVAAYVWAVGHQSEHAEK
jgi:glucose/arabinose dehydrogenase/mono/diheme cytochrome c family protein